MAFGKRFCARCNTIHNGKCPEAAKHNWGNKKKRSGRGGRAWSELRQSIFERDNYQCQMHKARGEIVMVDLHGANHGVCDHIVPLDQGGSNDPDNLQTLCQECDRFKTRREQRR